MRPDNHPRPWWHADRHADRKPFLMARLAIRRAIRSWFDDQGFVEVEPACLQTSPGNEVHLHAFATTRIGSDLSTETRYLHTSPEFAMKKLIAAGEDRIYALAPVFRNREDGPHHANEFTMLEWYRRGAAYTTLFDDCAALLRVACAAAAASGFEVPERLSRPINRISVADAFGRFAGLPLSDDVLSSRDAFATAATAIGVSIADDDTWGDIFSRVLTERIEPHLGKDAPDIFDAYPITEAALARPLPDDPRFAERFELYGCGMELANGFGELTDAGEQRRRFATAMHEKMARYGTLYPIDDDFIAAVAAMPPTSGCALGFDRLVMAATGARTIDQVIWTPAA